MQTEGAHRVLLLLEPAVDDRWYGWSKQTAVTALGNAMLRPVESRFKQFPLPLA